MSLSREDVEKVALLARLRLSDSEIATITEQLRGIVAYVDQLSEVDTEGIEPLAHAIETSNVFRVDQVGESLSVEEALANAPHHDGRGYLVPAVLAD